MMSKTFNSPRGIFPDSTLGVLEFHNGDTDILEGVYYDRALTTLAPNPLPIDANGYHLQVWGNKFYKVKQYARLEGSAGIFPDDFAFIREWFEDLSESSGSSSTITFVETVAQLKALAPVNGDKVILLGYYSVGDARTRTMTFNATSVDTPNYGNRIRPNGYGTGVWIDDSSTFIDARDFGCMHPTLTTNSNISNAISYCSVEGIELKFPAGVYNVSGGEFDFDSKVSVDAGAFFNVIGASVLTFKPYVEFDLPTAIQFGTTQYFILDLTGSNYTLKEGASLEWWNATTLQRIDLAIGKCGSSGIAIRSTVNVPVGGGAYGRSLNRIVFHQSGILDIDATAGTFELHIYNVEFIGRQDQTGIFTGNYTTSIFLVCDAYSSWFESSLVTDDDIISSLSTDHILHVDNYLRVNNSVDLGKVAQAGGYIEVTGGNILTLSVYGYGKDLISVTGSGASVVGCYNVDCYQLVTSANVEGFIRSCNLAPTIADFKGVKTSVNVTNVAGMVENWYCVGTVSASSLNAKNCKFISTVTSSATVAIGCDFATLNLGAIGGTFSHVLKSCTVSNQIVCTSLITDTITKLVLHDCMNLGTSTPLVVSSLLASSFVSGGYVSVKDNLPVCYDDSSVPTGTWAQSYIDCQLTVPDDPAPALYSYELSGKSWALKMPNLAFKSTRLLASSDSSLASATAIGAHTNSAFTHIFIGTTGDLTSTRPVRVQGNLY